MSNNSHCFFNIFIDENFVFVVVITLVAPKTKTGVTVPSERYATSFSLWYNIRSNVTLGTQRMERFRSLEVFRP